MNMLENLGPIVLIILAIEYLVKVYPTYIMFKRANLKNPWIAFIPGVGQWKTYNLANFSMWWVLGVAVLTLIPVVGSILTFIFLAYRDWKIAENFGLGILGRILSIFFSLFVVWYIVLTKKDFQAIINHKFTQYNGYRKN